jgi:hypothetical protein
MKRRLALGALLVLGGLVSLGALLMWGPVGSTPEASATPQGVNLVAGRTQIDVGDVAFWSSTAGMQVVFTAADGQELEEVHVCIAEGDSCNETDEPDWTPPGRCPWKVEFSDPDYDPYEIEVSIPLNDPNWPEGLECNDAVWIQAHAAMHSGQTAYGDKFKGSFCVINYCCS